MSLPARRCDGQPARGRMDPAGLARGQAPGPQRGPGTGPRARHAGIGPGETGAAVTHRRACSPDRIRTSSQPDPARSMTGIRQPDSGKPRAHQIVWETGEAQGSAAGAGKSGSYLDDLAPGSVRACPRLRVVWCGRTRLPLGFSVLFVFRQLADSAGFSRMFGLVVLHIRERMPVSRASPASQRVEPGTARGGPAIEG